MIDHYSAFLAEINHFAAIVRNQQENLSNPDYFNADIEMIRSDNCELYKAVIGTSYYSSYINPGYAKDKLGAVGKIASAILFRLYEVIEYVYRKQNPIVERYYRFIEMLEQNSSCSFLHRKYHELCTLVSEEEKNRNIYLSGFYNDIVNSQDKSGKSLYRYGLYVNDSELRTMIQLNKYDREKLKSMAEIIAKAYDRSFVTQNKERGNRNITKVIYHLGQENLVELTMNELERIGYTPQVTEVISMHANRQCDFDHHNDIGLILNDRYVEKGIEAIKIGCLAVQETVKRVAGFVRLMQFGEDEDDLMVQDNIVVLSERQSELLGKLSLAQRTAFQEMIPKAVTSYTGAAFPSSAIASNFLEVFDAVVNINMVDGTAYEFMQEKLVTVLDKASCIRITGRNGNETDISVSIQQPSDPSRETAFKNTGADVNIPVGEVFTSPVLEGTSGLLHVKEFYHGKYRYENLRLRFTDGFISEFSCTNFKNEEANTEYILDTLLYPHRTLPMGEFAIGTNTLAYTVSEKYHITGKLPGLILEKMGLHFAIGDTCFAFAEDHEMINHISNKVMIAKDNSFSIQRINDVEKAYFNTHVDITIPYDDLAYVKVITDKDNEIPIILNGLFSVEGTEILNEPLLK